MGCGRDGAAHAPVPLAGLAAHVRLLVALTDLTEVGAFGTRTLTHGFRVTGCR